jgi:hypothetical protein
LAALKKATGIIEDQPDSSRTQWMPNLQLLVGFKAVEGSKQALYFVQLTTLRPPPTNDAGPGGGPPLRTNAFDWSGTNSASSNKTAEYIASMYPVRVRVFDESARVLKEGQATLPWGLVTNGLADMCRISLDNRRLENQSIAPEPAQEESLRTKTDANRGHPADDDELMRSAGGAFLWLATMMGQIQTVPALNDVWEKAHCAFRLPNVWSRVATVLTGQMTLSLAPRLKEVSAADPGLTGGNVSWYRLPVDLRHGKRNLTCVEIIVGPASGAEVLLSGIRSIRAVHPVKPRHEFIAQLLAAGRARDNSTGTSNPQPE